MKAFRIIPMLTVFILLATSCQPVATTPPPPTATSSPPTTTPLPTESPPPAPTKMPAPTLTPIPAPTAIPTIESETQPWQPTLPEEPCIPSETRTCQVLFVLPAEYYAEAGRSFPDQFRDAGYAVTVASNAPQVVEVCENTVRVDQPAKDIPVDLPLAEVRVAAYDAVIFIGGLGCQDQWHDEEAHRIAQEAVSRAKVLGAAGCASTILAYAGAMQGKTAAVCADNPPVKHGQDYCAVLQSQGAICSQAQIARDGLIVTAKQKSPFFVAGVIQVIMESSPAAPVPLLQKSPQEFDSRGTFQAGLGDLDGDGDLDAVFANPQRHNSEVWLNDGSGTLVDTGQQLTQYGHGVGVTDFDEDGDLDAFIACHQFVTPSKIYLNDSAGLFQDTGQDLGDRSISAAEVNLVDLNGDGHTDVHVMYYDPNGLPDRVYLNDGNATFTDSGLALDEETIAWGDLDADGDVDYFGKRWGQGYVVQLNDGSGHFSAGWHMDDSQSTVGGVALADLNGDGDLDALVTNGFRDTGSFPSRLLWNDGSGQFSDSGQRLDATLGAELAVGDLDGDGDLDVFVSNMDLPNEVWLNDGGQLVDSGLRLGDNSDMSGKPSLGDLDGDGDLDLFVGSLSGKPEIWFNATVEPSSEVITAENVSRLEQVAFLELPSNLVSGLVFSPDGRRLVAADYTSGRVVVWEVGTWQQQASFLAPGQIAAALISPDGQTLVTASSLSEEAGTVTGWDWAGKELFAFPYAGQVLSAAFSPDGHLLVVGGMNHVTVWDVETRAQAAELVSDHTYVTNVAFFADGKQLLASYERDGNVMKIWDMATFAEVSTFTHVTERIDYHDLVFSPDGATLAVASTQNPIKLLDVETWQVVKQFVGHTRGSYQVAFSPDGSLLASACDDATLRLWEVESGDALKVLDNRHEVGAVRFSPDGTWLALGVWDEGVQVWAVTE
jgi:WD40 repeat protein/putative intracellular protease/amidase